MKSLELLEVFAADAESIDELLNVGMEVAGICIKINKLLHAIEFDNVDRSRNVTEADTITIYIPTL